MSPKQAVAALAEIEAPLRDAFAIALLKAYNQGLEDGRRVAAEELSARVASVLHLAPSRPTFLGSIESPQDQAQAGNRAPKGTVAPAVLDALEHAVRGKRPAEIAAEKGIPENSARGMLNRLRQIGRVEKRGDLWFLAKHEEGPGVDASGPS